MGGVDDNNAVFTKLLPADQGCGEPGGVVGAVFEVEFIQGYLHDFGERFSQKRRFVSVCWIEFFSLREVLQ